MANRKKYIKRAYSKDNLSTFSWAHNEQTVYPNFSFAKLVEMIDDDPVARGALNHFVDKFMEGDHAIVNRKTLKYDRTTELILDEKFKFRTDILRKIALVGKIYNNVFLEIVKDTEGRTKALNILNSATVKPITEPNGDPIKYKSTIASPSTGKYPEWDKDEIVWFKFGDRTVGFAPVDMKALWENLLMKSYIKRYIAWLWQTGQYRILYNFKSSTSDQDIEDFLAYAKRHDDFFKVPFLLKGELETKLLRDIRETESIVELLKYLDSQTLILMRIPPIDVGIPDASGRSNADAQSNSFMTHVIGFKKIVEDIINFDLFPKINKGNNLLMFSPGDRFSKTAVIDNAQKLKALGFSNEAIEEYFMDEGMVWKTSELFNLIPEPLAEGGTPNPKEKDMYLSRQRKGEGEANERIGTGEQSTTRDDQVGKQ